MKNSYIIILLTAVLIASIGVMSIYSSSYRNESSNLALYQRQILWILLGLILFLFMSRLNYRRLWDAMYFLYGLAIILLLLVYMLGAVRMGAQRWLKIAWFNFQPSEIAKLIIVLFLARYFSGKSVYDVSLAAKKFGLLKAVLLPLIFIAIPMAFIVEQPDLGSSLILFFIFIAMVYLAEVKLRHLIIFLVVIIAAMPLFWRFLKDYQKERLLVFLNPNIDPLGAGYTVIQAKIAIGSGGLFGKGWLSGTQSQLRFLPEAHTDFIFATFAEEWGYLGVCALLYLYFLLIRQGIIIAEKTSDRFGKLLASGISLMLGIQLFINIAMNLGLAPVVGLPLPLMSYGGSSLFVTFISLGILVSIDRRRAVF